MTQPTNPTPTTTPLATLTGSIDALVERLREVDTEAAAIRQTLRELQGKLAAASKRAGRRGNGGRRRRGAPVTTDAATAATPLTPQ